MASEVLVIIGVGGMGEAIARRIGSGKRVLLADFNDELLQGVAARLSGDGFDVETETVDVSSHESVRALAQAAAQLGAVTLLAHTAGLSPAQASATAIMTVDLAGFAFSLDEFGAVIAPGGAGVYIASMAGTMGAARIPADQQAALATASADELATLPFITEITDPGAAYSYAKRGNQLRVQAAAPAWGQRGARVNSISPGIISTPMGQQELASESGAQMRGMLQASATGRLGTASDIAAGAAFLLGPDSSFITGTDLLVDGGAVAGVVAGAYASGQ